MNGAEALLRTLVASGVDVCFTNPGTSEMHAVAALDRVPDMRAVLGLFEGTVTGAADGYARMAGRPAATLLHLGPGLGNGFANLHNARRARTPIVNVIGDHARDHQHLDAPLQSDIEAVAGALEAWTRRSRDVGTLAADAVDAVTAAYGPPGCIASLVVPADLTWTEGAEPSTGGVTPPERRRATPDAIESVVAALRSGEPAALLLGGSAVLEPGLLASSRVARASGARQFAEVFPARIQRGAGLPAVPRLAYLPEMAEQQLAGLRHLILVEAAAPVAFFGYPGRRGELVPDGCEVHILTSPGEDSAAALEAVADTLPAPAPAIRQDRIEVAPPSGPLTVESFAAAVASLLPQGAIVSDEAQTSGILLADTTAGAPRHDVLTLTGGAIGQGLPVAVGAAVACPDRPVLALQADGSAMYTLDALHVMARENLDVTVVVLSNGAYAILRLELQRVGADVTSGAARDLFDLTRPGLDFVSLGQGMGVPSTRATTADELVAQLRHALVEPGPHLIEALVPSLF